MRSEEVINFILDKKFKKTVFSGYEATDVDAFFDKVIEYIKDLEKNVNEYKAVADKAKSQIEQLTQENANLLSKNNALTAQNKNYEANGYGNVIWNNTMEKLEKVREDIDKIKAKKGE